jgi:hypothetical protein
MENLGQVGRKEKGTVLLGSPDKPADFHVPLATASGQNNVKVNFSPVMLEIKKKCLDGSQPSLARLRDNSFVTTRTIVEH